MATRQFDINRTDGHQQVAAAAGGAIAADIRVTIEDVLTTEQAVVALEKVKMYLLENGEPK